MSENTTPEAKPETKPEGKGDALLGFNAAAGQESEAGEKPTVGRVIDFNGEKLEVPEAFWDKEADALNGAAAVKAALDLRKQLSDKPKAPEKYEFNVPEDLKDKVVFDAEAPEAKAAMELAKKHGLSNEAFGELLSLHLQTLAGTATSDDKTIAAEIDADAARLIQIFGGEEQAKTKIAELDQWLFPLTLGADKKPDPGKLAAISSLRVTAAGTELLFEMRKMMGQAPLPGSKDAGAGAALSETELKAMVADPRYHRDHDPTFIKQVQEGFKKLYPGEA
jgi:hypothetical protein